jgi:hypothetical protein
LIEQVPGIKSGIENVLAYIFNGWKFGTHRISP